MTGYTVLNPEKGEGYMPKVWNLFFKPIAETDYFVEPWGNLLVRDCSEFRDGKDGSMELVFCGASETIETLLDDKAEADAMVYGAYNQVNVCQMRALGTVFRITSAEELESIKNLLRERVKSKKKMNGSSIPMTNREVAERLAVIDGQPPYRFVPREYAYMTYERG